MLLNISARQQACLPVIKNPENTREKFSTSTNDFSRSCLISHSEAQALRAKALFFGGKTVGNIPDFIKTSKEIAETASLIAKGKPGKKFKNLPPFILNNFKDNVDKKTGVIYCSRTKHDFNEFLGNGTAKGNIIVLRKRG